MIPGQEDRGARRARRTAAVAVSIALGAAVLMSAPTVARADGEVLTPDIEIGAVRQLDATVSKSFGFSTGLHLEINVLPWLGVHLGIGIVVTESDYVGGDTAFWIGVRPGLRFHLCSLLGVRLLDCFIDAHENYGRSGEIQRHGFDAGVGVAVKIVNEFRLGPFARLMFESDPGGQNPILLVGGLTFGLFERPRSQSERGDADHDGQFDDTDECPDAAPGEHPDPNRTGCPAEDSDGDGLYDPDDACPTEPMGSTPNMRYPGCPPSDVDGDGVPDDSDVCPLEPAPRNAPRIPLREGCPAGVIDD